MLEFDCDKCSSAVIVNQLFTSQEYNKILRYEVLRSGEVVSNELPPFLYYECVGCGERYKLDIKEYELRVRKATVKKAVKLKNSELRSQINPYKIDPDNGLKHCGVCEGVDKEGNCFVDYIKQCPIRKLKDA